jgi:hypothetical protein
VVQRQESEGALVTAVLGIGVILSAVVEEVGGLFNVGNEVGVGDADALGQPGGAGAVVDGCDGAAGFVGTEFGPFPRGCFFGGCYDLRPVLDAVADGIDGVGELVDALVRKVCLFGCFEDNV